MYGSTISTLRTDNAREFLSNNLSTFFSTQGIAHQTSCPYTPQQNGVAERKIRHITETARTLLHHMHVPHRFWSHAILTSTYLINRLPSTVLQGTIPWDLLHPTTRAFPLPARVFGCACYVHIHGPTRRVEMFYDRGILRRYYHRFFILPIFVSYYRYTGFRA